MGSCLGDLFLDRLACAVRQALVLGVDPQERGSIGMGEDRASEVRLDQVVEALVEVARIRGGRRPAELECVEVQCRAPTGWPARPTISWRTSRLARRVVVTSASVTS
jgi:hypothetical protein